MSHPRHLAGGGGPHVALRWPTLAWLFWPRLGGTFHLLCARFGWVWRFTLSAFLACFLSAAFGNIDYTQKSCACCQFGNIFSDTENAYTARVSDNPGRQKRTLRVWFIVPETQKSVKKRTKRAVRKPIHRKGFRQYYDVSEQFFQKKNISEIAVSLVPQGVQAIGQKRGFAGIDAKPIAQWVFALNHRQTRVRVSIGGIFFSP